MTPEILAKYMAKHKTEINQRYQKLHDAYENKYKIDKMEKKPDWKPDNRIPVNFAKYITDTMNGFFIGIPIKTTADDETVSQYLEFWISTMIRMTIMRSYQRCAVSMEMGMRCTM